MKLVQADPSRLRVFVCALLVCLLPLAPALHADEGMWTYDNFPKSSVAKAYGFSPDDAWLDSARRSSLRLAGGCSGSFVSSQGLVMTNHHCARSCISQLSNKAHDYLANGFYAPAPEAEVKCPEIELNELLSMTDVTARVAAATHAFAAGSPGFAKAQQSAQASIESECAGGDKKTLCQVVALYHGGIYSLYKYRRYQDVRLVFAPESNAPKFGGDPDNFDFPRWALDMTFLRAWDDDKPAHPEHWFRWNAAGPKEGELTFISGNPGSTRRLYTAAQYQYERDVVLPERLLDIAELRGQMTMYASEGPEHARASSAELLGLENSYKGLRGRLEALTDPKFLPAKMAAEEKLRAAVKKKPALDKSAGKAWNDLAAALEEFRPHRKEFAFAEGASSATPGGLPAWFSGSRIMRYAKLLVRAAAELPKPDADRLREWGDAKLPAVQQALASTAPVGKHFEIVKLTFGLTKLREQLGTSSLYVKKVLGPKAPAELAAELVNGSKLDDPAVRKALFEGGQAAIDASTDPAIVLVREVDAPARAMRKWVEDDILAKQNAATEAIARARFALEGTKVYPDATFTLRLSYGAVKGWTQNGHTVTPFTDFAGAFAHQTGRDPFQLPASWNSAQAAGRIDEAVPFDFASDNDIIGGNSGSPVFNQNQEIVGLVFDGNLPSLGGDYGFDESMNRAVSVDSAAMIQALDKIYGATRVLNELQRR